MNYRHEFHAGNFADVFKHAVLTRVLLYLARKPAPFRVIDTHAGSGLYDLSGEAADRTGEWRQGIARIAPDALSPAARELLAPYLAIVGDARSDAPRYPGSPLVALALCRPLDRMIFCETSPAARAALTAALRRDRRAKVLALDGYTGLGAFVPPVERRGIVLIDPPFEAVEEFERLTAAVLAAHARWRGGIICAWYPIKERRGPERLAAAIAEVSIENVLRLELAVAAPSREGPLVASGLIVVNPPFVLEAEMACLLPELARQLARGRASSVVERLGRCRGATPA